MRMSKNWCNLQANESNIRQYKSVSGEDGLETTVLGLTVLNFISVVIG